MRILSGIVVLVFSAIAAGTAAGAVSIVNGSFEDGVAIGGAGTLALPTGDTSSITGWTVLSDGIDYLDSSYLAAADGSRSVELSALASGGIVQSVSGFTPGRTYELRWQLASNANDPAPRPKDYRGVVSATGGTAALFGYTLVDGVTAAAPAYTNTSYRFVASADAQDIQFRSLGDSEFSAVIDNVSVAAVPEPANWALLIIGFGFIGLLGRRGGRRVAA